MTESEVIKILCREIRAYGLAWRLDWSDFDGRSLRDQLNFLASWAERNDGSNFTDGTEFLKAKDIGI